MTTPRPISAQPPTSKPKSGSPRQLCDGCHQPAEQIVRTTPNGKFLCAQCAAAITRGINLLEQTGYVPPGTTEATHDADATKPKTISGWERTLSVILIVMGLLTAAGTFADMLSGDNPDVSAALQSQGDFQTDNAVGASANALQKMEKMQESDRHRGAYFADALLMWVLAAGIQINARLRFIANRP